jgi:hypothetical protein
MRLDVDTSGVKSVDQLILALLCVTPTGLTIVATATLTPATAVATLFQNLSATFTPSLSSSTGSMRLRVSVPMDPAATGGLPLSRFAPNVGNADLTLPLPALQLSASLPMRGIIDLSDLPVQLNMPSSGNALSSMSWTASNLMVYVEGMLDSGLSRVSVAAQLSTPARPSVSPGFSIRAFGDWNAATRSIDMQGVLNGTFQVPRACALDVPTVDTSQFL